MGHSDSDSDSDSAIDRERVAFNSALCAFRADSTSHVVVATDAAFADTQPFLGPTYVIPRTPVLFSWYRPIIPDTVDEFTPAGVVADML